MRKWEAVNTNAGFCVRGEYPKGQRWYIARFIPTIELAELMAAAPEMLLLLERFDQDPEVAELLKRLRKSRDYIREVNDE